MKAFTLVELIVVIAIIGILVCLLGGGPIEALFQLCFGWIFYLRRVSQEVTVDWPNVLFALVSFLLFSVGCHWFAAWAYAARRVGSPSDQLAETTHRTWRWKWSMSLSTLIVLVFVAGTAMIGLTHQISWAIQDDEPFFTSDFEGARRMQSSNNLKQIGWAVHNYNDIYRTLPAGVLVDDVGLPLHGWQTLLLPYLEQAPLFDQINLTKPWDHESNRQRFEARLYVFEDPGARGYGEVTRDDALAPSHYSGNRRLLFASEIRTMTDITDGVSNTILAGEIRKNIKPWGYPVNCRDPALGINSSPQGFGVPQRHGAQFVLADGSVRFLPEKTDPEVLKALATPNGAEDTKPDGL